MPRLAGGETLLQRLQAFASNTYGPLVAAGIAMWHRDQGNYWGHNAIIRTRAFAAAAGLPDLAGRKPFGGHILSHDFVEAVLLQRAGWGVHMMPTLDGSYESMPPNIIDVVARDRRWAQGNLQHLAIVSQPGVTPMGRVHLGMGAASYLISVIWALSLIVGVVLALQGRQLIPSYFQDAKTLFPIWPVIDPGAALRLFLATLFVVLLPKGLGLLLEWRRARSFASALRSTAGVAVETVYSMLIAPILMVTQTVGAAQILMGFDSGWSAQKRDQGALPFAARAGLRALAYSDRDSRRVRGVERVAGPRCVDGAGHLGSCSCRPRRLGDFAEMRSYCAMGACDRRRQVAAGHSDVDRQSGRRLARAAFRACRRRSTGARRGLVHLPFAHRRLGLRR